MARGLIGGILAGGVVSVVGLGGASLLTELPAGNTPPAPPLVEAPEVSPAATPDGDMAAGGSGPSTPVGALEIEAPQAPDLPEGEQGSEPATPPEAVPEIEAPRADTDPLDVPEVVAIEGAMDAPDTPEVADLAGQPVDPVLPNPQSLAPQTPDNEADLTVSTAPAAPTIVVVPDEDVAVDTADDVTAPDEAEDFFVIDLGADAPEGEPASEGGDTPDQPAGEDTPETVAQADEDAPVEDAAPGEQGDDLALAEEAAEEPRLQLQGGENSLLADRDTGVTIRRPGAAADAEPEAEAEASADVQGNALIDFAADAGDTGSSPLMSIVLIDDGSMSAASAALAGLPFPVTIALDPAMENAAEVMAAYRSAGFEVAVMAMLPEGAQPTDVEITFESVFSTLPETVAVLDIGKGGLQSDREVTEQAMDILATQGRGFVTISQGLNMAGRAAEAAGVPAAVVYRDLDAEDQDARVVRRFVDQAAFRARQESGVVLVGRVRPDTISALILWGTANQGDQVAVVPVSAILTAQ